MTRSTVTIANTIPKGAQSITEQIIWELRRKNKSLYGDFRMEGGNEDPAGGDPKNDDGGDPKNDDGGDPPKDLGFPANTPVAEMTSEQQTAYWKHQSKKHETAYKSKFGDLTPEQLKEMRDKAAAHDAMEEELRSDQEKAVAAARKEGEEEATAKARDIYMPQLFRLAFSAATNGKLSDEEISKATAHVNLSSFLNDKGELDHEAVAEYATPWASVKEPVRRGPSRTGLGNFNSGGGDATGVSAGRELWREKQKKAAS